MKFLSRKFTTTLLLIVLFSMFRWFDKLSNELFVISVIIVASVYMFVNGAIKIQELKILNENFKIEIQEDENESNNNEKSK